MRTFRLRFTAMFFAAGLLLLCSAFPVGAAASMEGFQKDRSYSGQFSDLEEGAAYKEDVVSAYEFGLINGSNGKFLPDGNVTVAEAVTLAARIRCIYQGDDPAALTKSGGAWYDGYAEYAAKTGIISANGLYGTYEDEASRDFFAYLLSRALPENEFPVVNDRFSKIPDMAEGDLYYNNILLLFKAGVVTGSDAYANFNPDTGITRAETAMIIDRVVDPAKRQAFVPLVGAMTLSESSLSLRPGVSVKLTAANADGADSSGSVLWKSTDESVATISGEGVVTAVSDGTAGIYTTEANGDKNSADCAVTVTTRKELTSEELLKAVPPAVFRIEAYDAGGKAIASAAGFFVSADGTAYTDCRGIDKAQSAKITTEDGATYTEIQVLGFDRLNDVAVLKVGGNDPFPHVTPGVSSTLQSGEGIYAVTNQEGAANAISDGTITDTAFHPYEDTTFEDAVYLQTSVSSSQGSSGSVLVNKYGEAVGMISSVSVDGEELNCAVPIDSGRHVKLRDAETLAQRYKRLYGSVSGEGDSEVAADGSNSTYKNAQEVLNGSTVCGTLESHKSMAFYSYTSEAAGVLELNVQTDDANSGNVYVFLGDSNALVYDMTDSGGSGKFYIKEPGTFTVFVEMLEDTGNEEVPYEVYFVYTEND